MLGMLLWRDLQSLLECKHGQVVVDSQRWGAYGGFSPHHVAKPGFALPPQSPYMFLHLGNVCFLTHCMLCWFRVRSLLTIAFFHPSCCYRHLHIVHPTSCYVALLLVCRSWRVALRCLDVYTALQTIQTFYSSLLACLLAYGCLSGHHGLCTYSQSGCCFSA